MFSVWHKLWQLPTILLVVIKIKYTLKNKPPLYNCQLKLYFIELRFFFQYLQSWEYSPVLAKTASAAAITSYRKNVKYFL